MRYHKRQRCRERFLSISGVPGARQDDAAIGAARRPKEITMQYAVLLYADAGLDAGPGAPEWEASLPHHGAFNQRLQERGIEYSGAALHAAGSATSLRRRGGERLLTDGPFAEVKEQLWGFYLVEAPDLDTVLDLVEDMWEAENGTIEIRPVIPMQQG
jgi:hypothetical protein